MTSDFEELAPLGNWRDDGATSAARTCRTNAILDFDGRECAFRIDDARDRKPSVVVPALSGVPRSVSFTPILGREMRHRLRTALDARVYIQVMREGESQ